jgi:hypothetical protein
VCIEGAGSGCKLPAPAQQVGLKRRKAYREGGIHEEVPAMLERKFEKGIDRVQTP